MSFHVGQKLKTGNKAWEIQALGFASPERRAQNTAQSSDGSLAEHQPTLLK